MHIFVHLLNDLSGSPRITQHRIAAYQALGLNCFVVTSGPDGFINLDRCNHKIIFYGKHRNKVFWIFRLIVWHLRTFLFLAKTLNREDTLHASTLLTSPQLLAAKLKGAKAILHVMETEIRPPFHKQLLLLSTQLFATHIIYLSKYTASKFAISLARKRQRVTYPCIDHQIYDEAIQFLKKVPSEKKFTIGMTCSLIWHKGYAQFIDLASKHENLNFVLVLNGSQEQFFAIYKKNDLPKNLDVKFNVRNIASVVRDLSLVLSLTRRDGWIETFGLTLVEAMAFGKPVIAPNIGGPLEFIEDGENGFLVDERDLSWVSVLILKIIQDPSAYVKLSAGARETARRFSPSYFLESIREEIEFCNSSNDH